MSKRSHTRRHSDSSSEESDDYKPGTHVHSSAAAAPAISMSTAARQTRIVPVAPAATATRSPADVIQNFKPSGETKTSAPISVSMPFHLKAPYKNLQKRPDKGSTLQFSVENKGIDAGDLQWSVPNVPKSTNSLDFPTKVKVTLDHDLAIPLVVETAMPATKSEIEQGLASTKGFIALRFQPGDKEKSYTREVSPNKVMYMNTFGGQTAETIPKFFTDLSDGSTDKPGKASLLMRPVSVISQYYNTEAEERGLPLIKETDADVAGRVYVDPEIGRRAVERAVQAHKSELNYTNYSDPKNLFVNISAAPTKTLDKNGQHVLKETKICDAWLNHPRMAHALAGTSAAEKSKTMKFLEDSAEFSIHGTQTLEFYHVDSNFKLVED